MRRRKIYFERLEGAPSPVEISIGRRVQLSEVDAVGIVWHGRYPGFFEEAQSELGRKCGLTYESYCGTGITAPVAQLHIDYHKPLQLDELFTVKARMIWTDAARINTEYAITGKDDNIVCTGFTIQMFVNLKNKEVLLLPPDIWLNCLNNWGNGVFHGI